MHEVGLMQSALDVAVECARREGAERILRMSMRVGAISGVVPESLSFAFEVLSHGTMAEGARLDIEEIPVACYCEECRAEFRPAGSLYDCPSCGQMCPRPRRGRELEIAELEIV